MDKTQKLKIIDHWLGTPTCVMFGLVNKLLHPFQKSFINISGKRPPKKILIIKFFGLGSITLASSLLKGIKKTYPDAALIFLTFKNNANLLQRLNICDKIITVDPTNLFSFIFSSISSLIYFSFNRPDVCFDLEFYSKFSTIMSFLSGARWRAGFYLPQFWRSSLVNVPIHFNHTKHILEIYSMFGHAIGVDNYPLVTAPIQIEQAENQWADAYLAQNKNFLLGINIHASDLAHCRRWPIEYFAQVINSLAKDHRNISIFLTGSQAEQAYTKLLITLIEKNALSQVIDLSGQLNFGKYLALLKKLNLFLTNDSGPFHLANAMGTKTISIWGPGDPKLYGPYQNQDERTEVIYKNYPCSPCMYIYQTDAGFFCHKQTPCLQETKPDEVIKIINDKLPSL